MSRHLQALKTGLFSLVVLLALAAAADPGVDVIFHGIKGDEDSTKTGLESGRYQTRDTNTQEPDDVPVHRKIKKKSTKKPASEMAPSPVEIPDKDKPSESSTEPQEPPPGLGAQVLDLFHGGAGHTAEIYREQIHPDDIRNNRVEVDVASGLVNNSSTGTDSYRNYSSVAPMADLGVHFWITPLMGISGGYQTTLGESIQSATSGSTTVAVKSEMEKISLDFRQFFGMSRRANSLQWGFYFTESKMNVAASEVSRVGLRSDSLGVYLETRVPTAPTYAWIFGGELAPYDNEAELATALNYSSGTSETAYRFGLHVGGEIKMNRQSQIFWTLGALMEKTQYAGPSSLADPATGTTPSSVSIMNTWSYFHLGYRWGQ